MTFGDINQNLPNTFKGYNNNNNNKGALWRRKNGLNVFDIIEI